jgi:thiamine-monophosphate kinase
VFVTGRPGRSAAGLAALRSGRELPEDLRDPLVRAYAEPRARVAVGRHLVANGVVAAVDLSDGLAGDLGHLCEESRAGITLEQSLLPEDPELARLGRLLDVDPLAWMLGPGDDYELACTVPAEKANLLFAIPGLLGVPVTPIGAVEAGEPRVALRTPAGQIRALEGGWDHLGPAGRTDEGRS